MSTRLNPRHRHFDKPRVHGPHSLWGKDSFKQMNTKLWQNETLLNIDLARYCTPCSRGDQNHQFEGDQGGPWLTHCCIAISQPYRFPCNSSWLTNHTPKTLEVAFCEWIQPLAQNEAVVFCFVMQGCGLGFRSLGGSDKRTRLQLSTGSGASGDFHRFRVEWFHRPSSSRILVSFGVDITQVDRSSRFPQ